MKALSLFSGIGGIDLACEWAGIETVAFCEREPFPQQVLKKHWPDVPIYDDVCTLTKERLEADGIDTSTIGLIHGGYPCQPFSFAGKREGTEDDRHLWPEYFRLVQEIRPPWVVGENVAGHVSLGLDIVLADLESEGYTARPFVIPACAVNAPHRRDRIFVVGHTKRSGCDRQPRRRTEQIVEDGYLQLETWFNSNSTSSGLSFWRQSGGAESTKKTGTGMEPESERHSENVADTSSFGQQRQRELIEPFDTAQDRIRQASESLDVRFREQWAVEPDVGRVANGVSGRVDRLKSLGNAVVPQQIYPILAAIKQIDDMMHTG